MSGCGSFWPVTVFAPGIARPGSPEERLLLQLDPERLPRHVAVIMDGNGRWAAARGQARTEGHRAGARAVRTTVESSARLGIEVLTLYAFSTENWKRPRHEVWVLMNLLREYLRKEVPRLVEQGIRLHFLGRWRELEPGLVRQLEGALTATAAGTGMQLNVALNYSGRGEIVEACRQIVADWAAGERVEIDERTMDRYLDTSGLPDPDLLVRTSGELRISNFLLWQLAYTELYVTRTLWPDFDCAELLAALLEYQRRERRFGGLGDEASAVSAAPSA